MLQGLKDEAEIFWVILHEFDRISMQSFDASGQEFRGLPSVVLAHVVIATAVCKMVLIRIFIQTVS